PPSLEQAIESFALVVAARRARGQGREHNSKLIHVTRGKAVQRRVVQQIREALDALANAIRYGGGEGMRRLRERWESDFAPVTAELALPDCPPVAWEDVEAALRATIESIRI
ncbi:endonuclease, partial [Escherichia coli]|uniref:Z1 domain-containing protein n=1 Tax=Escherichia coli TaxID=562 RepID=UPI00184C6160